LSLSAPVVTDLEGFSIEGEAHVARFPPSGTHLAMIRYTVAVSGGWAP
jgi:hypothetical protein